MQPATEILLYSGVGKSLYRRLETSKADFKQKLDELFEGDYLPEYFEEILDQNDDCKASLIEAIRAARIGNKDQAMLALGTFIHRSEIYLTAEVEQQLENEENERRDNHGW